jgi:hypothetical protein
LVKLLVFEFSVDWEFVFDWVLLDEAPALAEAEKPNAPPLTLASTFTSDVELADCSLEVD